jgi:hypoxanthine phosphoribosyltransferase
VQSYDYANRAGVLQLSWADFGQYVARLAERLVSHHPQVVVGVARAGLFPATAVACMLRCELFPVRVTRRLNDEVIYERPIWKTPVPPEVAGKVVVVVDEIADTGETLAMVAQAARDRGAKQVLTASLVSHSWAKPGPDICTLISDALLIFPWDERVLIGGQWQPHPEIVVALKAQKH